MEDDLTAIRQLVADAQRHQLDADEFLPLHTPEAVIVNIAGRRVLGRDAIGDAMRQALAGPLAKVLTTVEIDDVRFVRPDVAVVSCRKFVADEREEPDRAGELPATGSLTYVAVREDGAWRLALAQTTPVAAAAA